MLQVFGKDTVLNMGGRETNESREQWLEDIEMKASLHDIPVVGPVLKDGDRPFPHHSLAVFPGQLLHWMLHAGRISALATSLPMLILAGML